MGVGWKWGGELQEITRLICRLNEQVDVLVSQLRIRLIQVKTMTGICGSDKTPVLCTGRSTALRLKRLMT